VPHSFVGQIENPVSK